MLTTYGSILLRPVLQPQHMWDNCVCLKQNLPKCYCKTTCPTLRRVFRRKHEFYTWMNFPLNHIIYGNNDHCGIVGAPYTRLKKLFRMKLHEITRKQVNIKLKTRYVVLKRGEKQSPLNTVYYTWPRRPDHFRAGSAGLLNNSRITDTNLARDPVHIIFLPISIMLYILNHISTLCPYLDNVNIPTHISSNQLWRQSYIHGRHVFLYYSTTVVSWICIKN